MKLLAVIDMQNDFINGALGTKESEAIVPLKALFFLMQMSLNL